MTPLCHRQRVNVTHRSIKQKKTKRNVNTEGNKELKEQRQSMEEKRRKLKGRSDDESKLQKERTMIQ
jgi:hypothetical protein